MNVKATLGPKGSAGVETALSMQVLSSDTSTETETGPYWEGHTRLGLMSLPPQASEFWDH